MPETSTNCHRTTTLPNLAFHSTLEVHMECCLSFLRVPVKVRIFNMSNQETYPYRTPPAAEPKYPSLFPNRNVDYKY